ncbi:hypothetical protein [Streptomyces sp. NPDC054834]
MGAVGRAPGLGWTDGAAGAAGSEEIGAPRPRRGVWRVALRWMEGVVSGAGAGALPVGAVVR